MPRVAILAYNHLATFELGCAIELFALPRPEIDGWYEANVTSFEDGPLQATGGISIHTDSITSFSGFDMVVVPSWNTSNDAIPGALGQALTHFFNSGGRILSFCSGAFLLAELGFLDKRQATTHWRYAQLFKQRFPQVSYVDNVLYVYDGQLGCSAGSAAAIDLGLNVIREDFGHAIANQVARRLVMSPHRSGGQSQFVEAPIGPRPAPLTGTLDWTIENLADIVNVDSMAEHSNMSRRSFDRHFRQAMAMSPKAWLAQQRLKCAQELLQDGTDTIEAIAIKCGFNNALTLRNNFREHFDMTPGEYRKSYSPNKKAAINRQ